VRVDSDSIDNLIKKEDTTPSKLSEDEKTALKERLETVIPSSTYTVQMEALDSSSSPFVITEPEFMRRMKEMQQTGGGGMFGMGQMPDMYTVVVNTNHELIQKIVETKTKAKQERLIKQSFDLAKLSKNLLKGEDLTQFINRSFELIK
jgi:molecular chaperone HtpG